MKKAKTKITFEKHEKFGATLHEVIAFIGDRASEIAKEHGKSCAAAKSAERILKKTEALRSAIDDLCYADFPERAHVDVYYPTADV